MSKPLSLPLGETIERAIVAATRAGAPAELPRVHFAASSGVVEIFETSPGVLSIKAKSPGSAKVTAWTDDNVSAELEIFVDDPDETKVAVLAFLEPKAAEKARRGFVAEKARREEAAKRERDAADDRKVVEEAAAAADAEAKAAAAKRDAARALAAGPPKPITEMTRDELVAFATELGFPELPPAEMDDEKVRQAVADAVAALTADPA